MKRYLLLPLLLALAGLTSAGQFFAGQTGNVAIYSSVPQSSAGDCTASFYASGPDSGTWTANVKIWEKRGDGGFRLIARFPLNQSGPYIDGSGTRVYNALDAQVHGGSLYFASIDSTTGTISTQGIYSDVVF